MKELEEAMKRLLQAAYELGVEAGKKPGETKVLRGTSEYMKCLFVDSRFARFEDFAAYFQEEQYRNIDIFYYYMAVKDWSASRAAKKKDWIATARNFMRADKEKGKLHTLKADTDLFSLMQKEKKIYG